MPILFLVSILVLTTVQATGSALAIDAPVMPTTKETPVISKFAQIIARERANVTRAFTGVSAIMATLGLIAVKK